MYDFILQTFFITSLAVIIYLMARSLPRIQEAEGHVTLSDYLEKWVAKLPLSKIDDSLNNRLEKFLRRTRVLVLKLDNSINRHLNKRKENGNDEGASIELVNQLNNKEVKKG
jgi:poly-D-alanine transfer protein DltD